MANQTPGSVTYYYGTGADTHWPIFIGTNGDWLFGKAGDLNSLTPALTQITDDAGRIESIYLNGGGYPVAVDYNQVYNGSGSLISYCETDYDYTVFDAITDNSLGDGDWQGWLQEIKTVWNGYDAQNNPLSKIVSQNDYTYDNAGLRLSNTISVQSVNSDGNGVVTGSNNTPVWASQRTENYTYDDLSRLATVNYGDGEQQSYQFDAMGNRTQKWDTITGTTSYSYNNANVLLTAGGNSYTNDADGNTLTGGGRTNTWNSVNRLIQSIDGGNTCQYDYSFDGLRRQQSLTSGGTTITTDYGLDNANVVREWTVANGALSPSATYLTGLRGVEYKRFDISGLVDWYIYDGLGSVVAEINPNGSVQASQNYDVYGNIRTSAGTSQTTNHFVGGLGHSSDQATGLIYMRARYYDPVTGRFISEDPEQNGQNWFAYVDDDPISLVDRTGKDPILPPPGPDEAYQLGLAFTGLALYFLWTRTVPGFKKGIAHANAMATACAWAACICFTACALDATGTVVLENFLATIANGAGCIYTILNMGQLAQGGWGAGVAYVAVAAAVTMALIDHSYVESIGATIGTSTI